MDVRIITDEKTLEKYMETYLGLTNQKYSGKDVYLETADVYGLFDGDDLVGGFCLQKGNNMACYKFMDKTLPNSMPDLDECKELNLVWCRPEYRRTNSSRLATWWKIAEIVSKEDVSYIVFAADSSRKGLIELYQPISSGVIYRGPVTKYPDKEMVIFYSTPAKFAILRGLYVPFLAMKTLKKTFRRFTAKAVESA